MVDVIIGDLFQSKAQTLVNTVNCVGVMGKGVALEFRKRFPEMYEDYVQRCKVGGVHLGYPYLYRRQVAPWIVNFPTKDHWRSVSRLGDIVQGLKYLFQHYQEWGIESLAVPPLGCGQGQLEWRVVGPTLVRYLKLLKIPVELYAPYGTPEAELQLSYLDSSRNDSKTIVVLGSYSRIEPAWVALIEVLFRIEKEPYHWPVGRTAFQKLAYFATESGIPTGLTFHRGSYGPYSPELKSVLTRLANNSLLREERLGRLLSVRTGPTLQDARREFSEYLRRWDATIDRLVDLFVRMNTHQAEVAATVHFATMELAKRHGEPPSEVEVLNEVMEWKQRRQPPFTMEEVALAIRNLAVLGWLRVTSSADLPIEEIELSA